MKHQEAICRNKKSSDFIKQMEGMDSHTATERPIDRISSLEQIISEVEKIQDLEDSVNELKEKLWSIKEVLTLSEACAFLGISESYLYRLTSSKMIPHYKPNGKMIFFSRKELCNWIMRNPSEVVKVSSSKNMPYE